MADAAAELGLVQNADGYDEVATRVKPSAANCWDMPSGSVVTVLERWVECTFKAQTGFIKAKNLPGVSGKAAGAALDVQDSFAGNKETCMRRHAEQDATKGNVVCFVPNGAGVATLVEQWVELDWRGNHGFVKARHVQPAPAGAVAPAGGGGGGGASGSDDAGVAAPPARGAAGSAGASGSGAPAAGSAAAAAEPPAKKAKIDGAATGAGVAAAAAPARARCKYGEGCYQKNPAHRKKFCHPGDADWDPPVAAPAADAPEAAAAAEAPAELPAAAAEAKAPAPVGAEAPAVEEAKLADAAEAPAAAGAAVAAPAAAPAEDAADSRDCDCCFDSVPTTAGMMCPGKGHFFCAACLANFLTAFKTADYADQKKGKGRALCPMKDSEAPFGDAQLAAFVPQEVFDDYLQIRIKVAEKGIQEQIEKENSDKIVELKEKLAKATGGSEALELDKHRLHIIDDIFTLKCPRCKMAFLDYDNCSAITCSACKCGFCSYCLEDCGKDAHGHFYKNGSKCPKEGGPLFIEMNIWNYYQNERKAKLLCEYLLKVPEGLRAKLAELCAPDAKDLGVKMPEDLTGPALALEAEAHAGPHDLKKVKGKGKGKDKGKGKGKAKAKGRGRGRG
eukprot:TRINITY_DN3544_c0_g4_i1.p1 TRINITY_DN3544_c0_g4~~TRINITY_DN3544_c0_g4_i1.p1  ORF type:complete len:629 (-),score=181.66 TRINITY_DN3544_c0_g4_i1:73-1926(-)